jgi:hypothetical protein
MSEYFDAGHDAAELNHEQYGNEHEHDSALHAFEDQHAAEHDAAYNHGHHEEFATPSGAHYSETDYTNYAEHDAEASHTAEVDATTHDENQDYAERLFAEQEHSHLNAFVNEHEHELPEHEHELGGHELGGQEIHHEVGHEAHGAQGHVGKAENDWVAN